MSDRASELRKEIDSLPETELFETLNQHKKAFQIYKDNYTEYIEHYNEMNKMPMFYFKTEKENLPKRFRDINKLERLIHNYIVSCYTLYDNRRNFNDNIISKFKKFTDYEEVKKLWYDNNGILEFVYVLRNYYQHIRIPHLYVGFSGMEEKMILLISYDSEELLKYNRFNGSSKKYINKFRKYVYIHETITDFNKLYEEFGDWFVKKVERTHVYEKSLLIKKHKEYSNERKKDIPFMVACLLDIYKRKEMFKKPEEIFETIVSEEVYKRIVYLNFNSEKRGLAFIQYINRIIPLHPNLNEEILKVFKEYSGNSGILKAINK